MSKQLYHHLLEVGSFHFSMRHGDAGFWHEAMEHFLGTNKVFYAVMDEENLSFSGDFIMNGGLNECGIMGMEEGFYGLSISGRGIEQANVSDAHQGELQGTRDGCSAEGKGIYMGMALFEVIFHTHAEFLFFVDDKESEVIKKEVLMNGGLRADEYGSRCCCISCRICFFSDAVRNLCMTSTFMSKGFSRSWKV